MLLSRCIWCILSKASLWWNILNGLMHIPLCHKLLKAQSHPQFKNPTVTFKLTIQHEPGTTTRKFVTYLLRPNKPLKSRPQSKWVEVCYCLILQLEHEECEVRVGARGKEQSSVAWSLLSSQWGCGRGHTLGTGWQALRHHHQLVAACWVTATTRINRRTLHHAWAPVLFYVPEKTLCAGSHMVQVRSLALEEFSLCLRPAAAKQKC